MAKRKKNRKRKRAKKQQGKRPSPKLYRAIEEAMAHFAEGDPFTARNQLIVLANQYKRSKPLLYAILEVSQAIEDWRTLAYFSEQLLPLEQGTDRAETLNNLVFAHIQLVYPALAYHFGQKLISQYPDYESVDQTKVLVETTKPFLLDEGIDWGEMPDLSEAEKLELMVQHDRVRFYTESGHPEEAIAAGESMINRVTNPVPILNNISLAHFQIGNVTAAVEVAQQALAQSPQNPHALGNLVRFCFLTGEFDEANRYAEQLAQISTDNLDHLTKQAEAFAFLGDDDRVKAAYQHAEKIANNYPLNAMLLHLAAAAHYRLGDEKTAWQLWERAVQLAPDFEMAQMALAERNLPVGERDVPWYWSFTYWKSGAISEMVEGILSKQRATERAIRRRVNDYLAERPSLLRLFPHILERGDRETREFILHLAQLIETPEFAQILLDFGTSRHGADDLRMEALQMVNQTHPHLLPENKHVPVWVNGKQTEIMLMGFEISDEPEPPDLPKAILDKHEEAHSLLIEGNGAAAEPLLKEIIAAAPDFTSAYNQLGVAYEQQGRHEEARALIEETHNRFPDYLFSRVALARMLIQDQALEEARAMLEPLLHRTKLHSSEFRALAQAQMELALANGAVDGARQWLSMWEQMEPDNPALPEWEKRINNPFNLFRSFGRPKRRRRKK